MTDFITKIKETLEAVSALAALATGGIWSMDELGRDGLTLERAQAAAGSTEVGMPPAIVVRMSSEVQFGQADATIRGERWIFEVYYYEDSGYTTIRQMMKLVRDTLDRQRIQHDPNTEWVHLILWRGNTPQFSEESLGGASAARSRYEAHITKN